MASEILPEATSADDPQSSSRPRLTALLNRVKSALRRRRPSKEPEAVSTPMPLEESAHEQQTPAIPVESPAKVSAEVPANPSLETPTALPAEAPAEAPAKSPATSPAESLTESLSESPASPTEGERPQVLWRADRQTLFEERARAIFAKHDLALEPDWTPFGRATNPDATVERVHKPIRIRVHRYCHRCETVFGPDKTCVKCEHKRCKKCPRYPIEKRTPDSSSSSGDRRRERSAHGKGKDKDKDRERARSQTREPLLVIQRRGAGQILVHQPIIQRVRRSCHKCQAQFAPSTSQECTSCGHLRCTRCPRIPSKPKKWVTGYPGDAPASEEDIIGVDENAVGGERKRQDRVFRKPRQRVRWHCDQCSTLFLEDSKNCRGCGHLKCNDCPRNPPKKNIDFDPAVVNALRERLSALVVTASAG